MDECRGIRNNLDGGFQSYKSENRRFNSLAGYAKAEVAHPDLDLPLDCCILYKGRPVLPCDHPEHDAMVLKFVQRYMVTDDVLASEEIILKLDVSLTELIVSKLDVDRKKLRQFDLAKAIDDKKQSLLNEQQSAHVYDQNSGGVAAASVENSEGSMTSLLRETQGVLAALAAQTLTTETSHQRQMSALTSSQGETARQLDGLTRNVEVTQSQLRGLTTTVASHGGRLNSVEGQVVAQGDQLVSQGNRISEVEKVLGVRATVHECDEALGELPRSSRTTTYGIGKGGGWRRPPSLV